MSHEKFNFVLTESQMVTPRVLQMSFRRADGQPFSYIPGQFITLHLPFEGMELRRSYSVATIPGNSGEVEIAVTHVDGSAGSSSRRSSVPRSCLPSHGASRGATRRASASGSWVRSPSFAPGASRTINAARCGLNGLPNTTSASAEKNSRSEGVRFLKRRSTCK